MSKVKRLIQSYGNFIAVPWREDAAPAQRVVFCVYDENEELRLRAKVEEFELTTRQAGHDWFVFDVTDSFAQWLASEDYAEEFFKEPSLLGDLLPEEYLRFLISSFNKHMGEATTNPNAVIAVLGVGALFGFAKVKDLVDSLAPLIRGRLMIFFPGSYENNNYRLLDGYDGWNYLAVPITADKSF
ncbi:MAG: BREX protein BrxB domain-containing protein [Desulfomicrobium sp.]